MIEFDGYIFGAAEKQFHEKNRVFGQTVLICSMLLFLPIIITLAIRIHSWLLLCLYCAFIAIMPLLTHIPKSKKEKLSITPKRIFIEGDYIVCVADKYEESRLISDVKQVLEYDEFYELVFPFGNISHKFICQKSLIKNGTLEEFEFMFDGKIVTG
jgi:hypothetical protein